MTMLKSRLRKNIGAHESKTVLRVNKKTGDQKCRPLHESVFEQKYTVLILIDIEILRGKLAKMLFVLLSAVLVAKTTSKVTEK